MSGAGTASVAMSFALKLALLHAKFRVAQAELAAERLKCERLKSLKSANNVSASPIAQSSA